MPSTESNLRDNTTLVNNNTTTGLLQTIQVLKQDLNQTRGQRDQIENQLSCLISLVKRSWMGDKVALFHVANIIGMPVPTEAKQFEEQINPQTRAKMNWERLSSRLLDREYQAIQEEIKERQQHYINYREDYMDEILNSHQEQMAQLTLHKQSNNALRDVDRQFMKNLKPNNRPPTGKVNKCPPAAKRPGKVAEDIVDKIDIGLGNLLFTGNPESQSHPQTTTDHKRGSITESNQPEEKSNGQYDDSHRYSKTNLFDTKDVFGSEAFNKKKRPCSASELRKKDNLRSRPKSAITGLKSGKADRPLKFETTQPVSGKTSAKTTTPDRRGSLQDSRQARNSLTDESVLFQQAKAKAELKSRIKSATQRPRDIDTYEDEVKNITDMENRFKQNAVDLQKKLGINKGMIY